MSKEAALRAEMTELCRSLFERGYVHGTAGNVSARLGDVILMSPTRSSLGRLSPEALSLVTTDGAHIGGPPATKEAALHLGIYRERPETGAVVHLHSTFSTTLSCLADTDPEDALPSITPYLLMRVGRVPLVPYHQPGSDALAEAVRQKARDHRAVLMANHGFVVTGRTFADAVANAEEFEENAKLLLLTRGQKINLLGAAHIAALHAMKEG
jgi:ribulose-5-phosphate 4-epimerase/fuculose-1-phosphate aldolase